mgnify:CR=1 FL=1
MVYVDDFNMIRTLEELSKADKFLKTKFEIKDIGRTKFCLGLQIQHLEDNNFCHQSAYAQKVVK